MFDFAEIKILFVVNILNYNQVHLNQVVGVNILYCLKIYRDIMQGSYFFT